MGELTKISEIISKLRSQISSNNVYVPWVKFSIKPSKDESAILTIDSESLNNSYCNIEYKKNGSGSANSFTIVIVHKPFNEVELLSKNKIYQDPNYIENKIYECINKSGKNSSFPYIEFQYGYSYPEELRDLRSDVYSGMLTDFTTELQDGLLIISLTGYSGSISVNNAKITTKAYKKSSNTTHLDILLNEARNNNFQITVYDKKNGLINNKFSTELLNDEYIESIEANRNVGSNASAVTSDNYKQRILIVCNPGYSEIKSSLQPILSDMEVESDKLFTDFVKDRVSSMISKLDYELYKNNLDSISSVNRFKIYDFNYIDNLDDYLEESKIDNTKYSYDLGIEISMTDLEDEESDADITFNWLSTKDSIVLGFKPSYQGSVLMSMYSGQKISSKNIIDTSGNSTKTYSINGEPSNSSEDDLIKNDNDIIKNSSYPYTAELQTIGIPIDIPILTRFNINALINDIPHVSSGTYMVQSSTDTIDSSGYISSFTLMKYSAPNSDKLSKLTQDKLKKLKEEYKFKVEEKDKAMKTYLNPFKPYKINGSKKKKTENPFKEVDKIPGTSVPSINDILSKK